MFNTASGVTIPFLEKIEEKYSVSENRIMFNLSFEKLKPFINDFVSGLSEPLCLVIQKPLNKKAKPSHLTDGPAQAEFLYFDLKTKAQINEALNLYGDILLNDGVSQFGIKSNETGDEIFIAKYKIAFIFSNKVKNHFGLLDKYDLTETDDLVTAWDVITADNPGKRTRVVIDNKNIFDVVEKLKKSSPMYDSKIVED